MPNNSIVLGSLSSIAKRDNSSLAEAFMNVDIVVLCDTSSSMDINDVPPDRRKRHDARDDALIRVQHDHPGKIAVVSFSDTAMICPTGIPYRFDGMTNLAGGLRFVAEQFAGLAKLTIVISDGEPDSEGMAIAEAMKHPHPISCIYVGPEDNKKARHFLERLANARGGTYADSILTAMLPEKIERLMLSGGKK
jgi:hypothetical protein